MKIFYSFVFLILLYPTQSDTDRYYWPVPIVNMPHNSHTHVEIMGKVLYIDRQEDGDLHMRVENGGAFVVAECIPELPCRITPKVGDCVKIHGISRFDSEHKWWEVHPVEFIKSCSSSRRGGSLMHANLHLLWLWLWFVVGQATYVLKRAYYLVTGPNPVANSYRQFFKRCWPPLLVRALVGAGVYWATFYPDVFNGALKAVGTSYQLHSALPQYAVVALFFGLGVDNLLDFGLSKIPILKDWLPQMPGPLKPENSTNP